MIYKKLICKGFAMIMLTTAAFAAPYKSYTYDYYGRASESPHAYEAERVIYGTTVGTRDFERPQDLFLTENGELFVLDKSTVTIIDRDFNMIKRIEEFSLNGKASPINNPRSVFVDAGGSITVADTDNGRVVTFDASGNISLEIKKPESEVFDQNLAFRPVKVVRDSVGNYYIVSIGVYQGALMFTADGEFTGYYGGSTVTPTSQRLADFFWKRILTKEQLEGRKRYVPTEIKGIAISRDDFIYTLTNIPADSEYSAKTTMDTIQKLNPKGKNILPQAIFTRKNAGLIAEGVDLNLVDVCADEEGYFTILDFAMGRIIQFDQSCNEVVIFGTKGSYDGAFNSPVAIECGNGKLFVLDSATCSVTVFALTDYGSQLRNALNSYNSGEYTGSIEHWKGLIKLNSNYELAYSGIGNALLVLEEYQDAMKYFKLGHDSAGYNEAFREYRVEFIRENFIVVLLFIGLFVTVVFCLVKNAKRMKQKNETLFGDAGVKKFFYPFYILRHPYSGMEILKEKNDLSIPVSIGVIAAAVLAHIFESQLLGTQFGMPDGNINVIKIILLYYAAVLFFSISNWMVGVLWEGKSTFKGIWVFTSYCLTPYILGKFLCTLLLNVLVAEEGVFIVWLSNISIVFSVILLIIAIIHFHEFTFKKSVISIFLTIFAMAIVAFILFLFITLLQQVITTFLTVYKEISFRL